MDIAVAVILLLVALFLVIKGGDIFVSSSTDLAKRAHIPQLIFGATFISLATTFPELLVAILSSLDGTTGLAVGNGVGSAICNIGLICGIAFVIMSADMSRGGTLKYYLLIVTSLFLMIVGFFFELTIWQAFVLIAITILFFIFNYIDSKLQQPKKTKEPPKNEHLKPLWLTILLFILGAGAVGGGAYLLIDKVEFLAKVIGVSEQFVGLTVIAIGTSLPELITVIASVKKKTPYLAVGNIIGSNILNLTLIIGTSRLCAWNYNMPITTETAYISLPFAFLLSIILVLPILIKKKTYRWQGILFLVLYTLYIAYLICNAIWKFI